MSMATNADQLKWCQIRTSTVSNDGFWCFMHLSEQMASKKWTLSQQDIRFVYLHARCLVLRLWCSGVLSVVLTGRFISFTSQITHMKSTNLPQSPASTVSHNLKAGLSSHKLLLLSDLDFVEACHWRRNWNHPGGRRTDGPCVGPCDQALYARSYRTLDDSLHLTGSV